MVKEEITQPARQKRRIAGFDMRKRGGAAVQHGKLLFGQVKARNAALHKAGNVPVDFLLCGAGCCWKTCCFRVFGWQGRLQTGKSPSGFWSVGSSRPEGDGGHNIPKRSVAHAPQLANSPDLPVECTSSTGSQAIVSPVQTCCDCRLFAPKYSHSLLTRSPLIEHTEPSIAAPSCPRDRRRQASTGRR